MYQHKYLIISKKSAKNNTYVMYFNNLINVVNVYILHLNCNCSNQVSRCFILTSITACLECEFTSDSVCGCGM